MFYLVDGWDGLDGWDGPEKCPLNLFILCGNKEYIYSTHMQNKNCHQHSYGFQNLMSSWGLGNTIFEITLCT